MKSETSVTLTCFPSTDRGAVLGAWPLTGFTEQELSHAQLLQKFGSIQSRQLRTDGQLHGTVPVIQWEICIGTKGILKIMFFTKWQFLLLCHQQTYILHQHFEQLLIGPTFYREIVIMATLHLSTGNWWIRRYYENCHFHGVCLGSGAVFIAYLGRGTVGSSYILVWESLSGQTEPVHRHTSYPPDRTSNSRSTPALYPDPRS